MSGPYRTRARNPRPRGYFSIGIIGSKNELNVGTLWRSASNFGANSIFTVGRRYPDQASDTLKTWRHIPLYEYPDSETFFTAIPKGCIPIGVELDARAKPLANFTHPERAIYVLGAEDNGIPKRVLERLPYIVSIPSEDCLNVAVAGSIVMYDRTVKLGAVAQLVERLSEKQEVAGPTPARPMEVVR